MEQLAQDLYDGPTLSTTINREGNRVHRLIDDTIYPLRANAVVVRRDPMVAALFGAVKKTAPAR